MVRIVPQVYVPRYVPTGNEVAIIQTNKGLIKVALHGKDMPITVANFIELVYRGFYDDTKMHGYKENAVIAGGCPHTRKLGPAQVYAAAMGKMMGIHPGTGDAGYFIEDEWIEKPCAPHEDGSFCMAHKSEVNSGSSQFYFSLSVQPEFDGEFSVFGNTIEGLEVVHALRIGDAIQSIHIEGIDQESLDEALSHEPPEPRRIDPREQMQEESENSEELPDTEQAEDSVGEERVTA